MQKLRKSLIRARHYIKDSFYGALPKSWVKVLGKRAKARAEVEYKRALAKVNTLGDGLGMPIDEKIKPLVAALNMWGIRTTASCEGHTEWGLPYPWVDVTWADAKKLGRLIKMPHRESDGDPDLNQWVLLSYVWPRLVPWDVKRPLEELQQGAQELAQWLRERRTWL